MAKNKKKTDPDTSDESKIVEFTPIVNAPSEEQPRVLLPLFEVPPTRNAWPENTETRPASVPLKESDFAEKGKAMAQLSKDKAVLEVRKKASAKAFDLEIDAIETKLVTVTNQISEGSTVCNVPCQWIFEYRGRREDGSWIPDLEGKTLVRLDTWDVIATGGITSEDRQTMLNFMAEHPAKDIVHSDINVESFLAEKGYTVSETGDDEYPFCCEGPTGRKNIVASSRADALPLAYAWLHELLADETPPVLVETETETPAVEGGAE